MKTPSSHFASSIAKFFGFFLLIFFILVYVNELLADSTGVANAVDPYQNCACEKMACDSCEVEANVEFYTAKCGPQNSKIKSCKKPICEPVADQDKCLAALRKAPSDDSENAAREIASVGADDSVGHVEVVIGHPVVTRANGQIDKLQAGAKIFNGDKITTSDNEKVKVVFSSTDEIHVLSKSEFVVDKFMREVLTKKRTLFTLNAGKVRARIHQHYNTDDNTFQIKTKSAVAGVRGTDFILSYELAGNRTRVDNLSGAVEFGGRTDEDSDFKKLLVPAGHSAELNWKEAGPVLSELRVLDTASIKKLSGETEVRLPNSEIAAAGQFRGADDSGLQAAQVCSSPTADFKQCSFTCEGNPKTAKTCRTDLPKVSCMRRLCGAGGEWIEPARMPSSQAASCEPHKAVVKDCGDYW